MEPMLDQILRTTGTLSDLIPRLNKLNSTDGTKSFAFAILVSMMLIFMFLFYISIKNIELYKQHICV